MTLSKGQIETLRNLSRKKDGDRVGWVSIAAARGLTELGLAARIPSGWRITAEGLAVLDQQDGVKTENVVAFCSPVRTVT